MNKTFKVVWSKAKQCYVVVSEVAKNHSGKKKIVVASVLAALAVGSEMTVVNVQATIPEGTVSGGAAVAVGPNSKATALHATAVGKEVEAGAAYSQAIGYQAKTTAQNGVAIGSSGVSTRWTIAGANDAVAIGTGAQSLSTNGVAIGRFSKVDGSSHSVALGTGSEALAADSTDTTSYLTNESVNNSGNGVISVGNKHKATDAGSITRRIVGVASGTEDYDAANIKQLKALEEKTHTRFLAVSGAANKTETDFPNETWTVGKTDATAGTTASELVLKGNYNNEAAAGERAVAVGPWANGIGARSVALGGRAVSNGMQAVALGQATFAYGENTLAVGSYASVNGDNSLAIGTDTFVGKTTRGANNKGVSETGDKTLFGVAIGFNARTYGTASVTLGKQAQADSLHSVVLGESSLSKEGDNTNTTAYLTNDAVNNSGNGVVSIGNADANVTRRIINVAGGTNDTDAVNVKQLKALETKSVQKFLSINGAANRTKANYADKTWTIGSPAVTAADGSVTTAATTSTINIMGNYDNEGARGDNSVALGPWANGIGPRSVALGSNAVANGNQAIALGQSTFGHGENTLAVGSYATVNGENSIAIGTDTYVGKAERNGTGKAISSTGDKTTFAVAIGFSAKAYGGASTVIGKSAQSDIAHSVVLGEGSKAVEADATNGTSYLTGDTVNNSGNGVVSVGNTSAGSNITRRIINVAGGSNDLDAVNVKQLKAIESTSLKTLTINNGGTKTDLTPQDRKLTLTAGNNVTLTPNAATGEVTISATGAINAINSGNANTLSVNNNNGTVTITPNTASNLSNTADANKLVTAGTVKSALDQKANSSDLAAKANASDVTALRSKVTTVEGVANTAKSTADTAKTTAEAAKTAAAEAKSGLTAKIDTTAERHVKEGSYAVQTDGTVTLTKVDGAGTEKPTEAVKITGLATKASVDTLTTKVGTVEATANAAKVGLADKADKSTVSDLTTKVGTVEATANAAKAGLADKADKSTVSDLTTKVGTVEATANAAKTGLADKADKATVTELTTKVGEVEATANAAKAGLADKADKATVEALTTEVGKKANAADVQNLTTNKLDKTAERHIKEGTYNLAADGSVTLTKVDGTGAEQDAEKVIIRGLASAQSVSDLTTKVNTVEGIANAAKAGLADKADKATVTELTTKVGEVEATANAAKAGLADKADKATVTELTTKVGEVEATANAAKAGLADKADKATVTELTTKVGEVEATANAAKQTADQANTAAGEAKTAAGEAKTAAGEAKTTAGEAKTAAEEAKTIAGEAKTKAEGADAKATEAKTAAEEAKTTAGEAKTAAGEAKTAAGEAKTAAEEAKTIAGEAKTKAESADAKATEAKTAAGEAKTAAEEAKTIAGEAKTKAEGADAKATEAKTAAEEAKIIAGEAKTKAEGADAKATEAKTTAAEAKSTADTAKQTADAAKQSADKATEQLKDLSTKVNAGIDKNLTDLSDAGKKVITDLVNVTGDNNIIVKPSVDEKTKVKTFTAKLNDTITLGTGDNAITVNGTNGTITAGNGDNAVTINGANGTVTAKNVKANDGVFGAPADAKGVPTAAGNTTTINNHGLSVVSKDAAGNVSTIEIKDGKISGLTPGKGDNDAATVGQVNDAIAQSAGNIGRALEKTSQRVDQVGAHAAALAAMNPLSYDPLRKSQIMAGIGSYGSNQALALGLAHYANENFMFNVGVTMGEGKSMANVGATYRFGTGDDDNIPERYKGGPISSMYVMQDEISALKAENARKDVEYGNKIDMLMERIAMLEAKLK